MDTKMKTSAALVLMATVCVGSAWAEPERPYLGLDYQLGEFKSTSGSTAKPSAVRLRAGTELASMFAVEAHAAFGTGKDSIQVPGVRYDVNLKGLYGLFMRPQLNLGGVASIYGLLGYSYADIESKSSNESILPSQRGFEKRVSYGGGIDFQVIDNTRISVDYVDYIDGYRALSAGMRYNF